MKTLWICAILTAVAGLPSVALADDAPTVSSVTVTDLGFDFWQVEGYVTDESPTTATAHISGAVSADESVASDGYFVFFAYVATGTGGSIDVYAVDAANQQSNVVAESIGN